MRVLARSLKGSRELQQDAYGWVAVGCSESGVRLSCALADGMGGVEGGGLASRLAVLEALQNLQPSLLAGTNEQWEDPRFQTAVLRAAFAHAAATIAAACRGTPALAEMATTLTVTVHFGSRVVVGHSGDTRVYVCGERVELLTRDHSAAWPLVESKTVEPSELRYVDLRSTLTQYVSAESYRFDVTVHRPQGETSFLLATDGLWELFDGPELEALMKPLGGKEPLTQPTAREVADELFEEARRRKPEDNASFILVAPDGHRHRATGTYPGIAGSSVFVRTEEEERHGEERVPV
jgi:protein phosphatase